MKILELAILAVSAILLLTITLWKRKSPAKLRDIPALTRLFRTLGLSVEDGTRLHISLGRGSFLDSRGGSGLAGLAVLRYIAERTSVSDEPAVASAGDPALGLLAQDTLQAGYQAAGVEELYVPHDRACYGSDPIRVCRRGDEYFTERKCFHEHHARSFRTRSRITCRSLRP
ncbi:MAG: hypothetical protein IPO36_00675 [Anaerolineales bacterium]|nr:hypothetical protein [Anaerolineales bacterium]